MIKMLLAMLCVHAVAAFHTAAVGSILGASPLRAAGQGRVIRTQKVHMSADVDRRKALAAIAVWQVAELGLWGAASPANAADDQAKLVEAALKKLCSVNPEKLPNFVCFDLKDLGVAIVDDGSPSAKAAAAAVKATGAVPILLKGDTKKMQETYRTFSSEPDGDFGIKASVAIVPNTKILKQVMAGNGLSVTIAALVAGQRGPNGSSFSIAMASPILTSRRRPRCQDGNANLQVASRWDYLCHATVSKLLVRKSSMT